MKKVKVEILRSIAGLANPDYDLPEHGYQQGDIVELHPELASKWIASGLAKAAVPSLEQLRHEVERKELELKSQKLGAELQQEQALTQIAWTGNERELANHIISQFERKEIEAANKRHALLRECRRYYIQKPDGSRKAINPESLWRNYNQQFR